MVPSSYCHRKSYSVVNDFFPSRFPFASFPPLSFRVPLPSSAPSKPHRIDLESSFLTMAGFLRSSPRPISISKLTHYYAYTADLSPGSLPGVLLSYRDGSLILEVGFTLRCLQRLSLPHFASLLCPWQNNSCTSGASIPVLSY